MLGIKNTLVQRSLFKVNKYTFQTITIFLLFIFRYFQMICFLSFSSYKTCFIETPKTKLIWIYIFLLPLPLKGKIMNARWSKGREKHFSKHALWKKFCITTAMIFFINFHWYNHSYVCEREYWFCLVIIKLS